MIGTMTNEELIADYRAGNADALNELAKQNRGFIVNTARSWCYSRQEFDDAFQECSLAFLLAAHGYTQGRAKFLTFAATAMHNHMWNLKIHRSAQKRTAKVVTLHGGLVGSDMNPADVVGNRLDANRYLKLVTKKKRKVLWLSMQGYTHPEIAKKTGVSFQRISQIKIEGLREIRECLTSGFDETD